MAPAPFSKFMLYWKPERPPPTTPMRRPAGTGFCCAMISFTLATAFALRVTGLDFLTSGVVVVVVDIRISSGTLYGYDFSIGSQAAVMTKGWAQLLSTS